MKNQRTIFIILILLFNMQCKSQNSILDNYYKSIKHEFPNLGFIKKEEIKEENYFKSFTNLLNEKLNKKIKMINPSHLAFEILNNHDDDLYRINLIIFKIQDIDKGFQEYSGQFNTKALISYIYIEENDKGYLLLINKFMNDEDLVINSLRRQLFEISNIR